MNKTIFNEINNCQTPNELIDLVSEYFRGQGLGGMVYIAPEGPAGPFTLMNRGMSSEWLQRYKAQDLHRSDPLLGLAFRLGHPERLEELVNRLPSLNHDEQCYVESLKGTGGLSQVLIVPTYGPFGRPAVVALGRPADPKLLDEIDTPLAAAVAQAVHTRMEFMQITSPPPGLSPREREILKWLGQGKSAGDIATILGVAAPTVSTHVQRIYHKLQVNDRASCIAKAMAHHYL